MTVICNEPCVHFQSSLLENNMNLEDFLKELRCIDDIGDAAAQNNDRSEACIRFCEALPKFLQSAESITTEKLTGLKHALKSYGQLRLACDISDESVDRLGHFIFMECSRFVLGADFNQLPDDEGGPKMAFSTAVSATYHQLSTCTISHLFLVLHYLIVNNWTHPTMAAMMTGQEVDENRALTYLRSGEFPELLRLRINMLLESGCEAFALNLCTWCVRSPVFADDVFIRRMHLTLLCTNSDQETFHEQCRRVPCCLAVRILQDFEADHVACSSPTFLVLATTFLVQDWTKSQRTCCTELLLGFWLTAQRRADEDEDVFLASVYQMVQIAPSTWKLAALVAAMITKFGLQFREFCSDICLSALKDDRHIFDMARLYRHDEEEAANAADRMGEVCRTISDLYSDHSQMYMACLMTAFYLDPKEEFFFKMQRHMSEQTETICVKPIEPLDFPDELYAELFDKVQTLRPGAFTVDLTWPKLMDLCVTHLSEVGYLYDAKTNVFHAIQPHPSRRPRKKKKSSEKRSRKKSESFTAAVKNKPSKVECVLKELVPSEHGGEMSMWRTLAISTGEHPAIGQKVVKQPGHIASDNCKVPCLVGSGTHKVATATSCPSLIDANASESSELESIRTGNVANITDNVSLVSVSKSVAETSDANVTESVTLNEARHIACSDGPTRDNTPVICDPGGSCGDHSSQHERLAVGNGDGTMKELPAEGGMRSAEVAWDQIPTQSGTESVVALTEDQDGENPDSADSSINGGVTSKTAVSSELAAKTDTVGSVPCKQHSPEKTPKTKTKAALVKLLRQRTVHGATVHTGCSRQLLLQDAQPAHAVSVNMQQLSLSAKVTDASYELSPDSSSRCNQTSHLGEAEQCGSSSLKQNKSSVAPENPVETTHCRETSATAAEKPPNSGTLKGVEPEMSDLESILHLCIVNALSVSKSKPSSESHKSPDDTNVTTASTAPVDIDQSSKDDGHTAASSKIVGERETVSNIANSTSEIPTFVQDISVDNGVTTTETVSNPSLSGDIPDSSVQTNADSAEIKSTDAVKAPCSATSDHEMATVQCKYQQDFARIAPDPYVDAQRRGDDSTNGMNSTDAGLEAALKPQLASCTVDPPRAKLAFVGGQMSDEDESSTDDGSHMTFKCRFCKRKFESLSRRRQHQEWVCSMRADLIKSGPGEFVCLVCGASFKKKTGLNRHVSRMHPEAISTDDEAVAKQKLAKVNGIKAVRVKKTKIRAIKREVGGQRIKVDTPSAVKQADSARFGDDAGNERHEYDGSTDMSTDDNDAGAEDTSVDLTKTAMRGRAKHTALSVINGSHVKVTGDFHLSQCTVRLSRLSADAIATYQKEDVAKPCDLDYMPSLCDLCGAHCLDVGMLEDHILDEHQITVVLSHKPPAENEVFLCEYCGDAFMRPSRLRAHVMKSHENSTAITDTGHSGNMTKVCASEMFVRRISDLLQTASKPEEFIKHIAATVDKVKCDTRIGTQVTGVMSADTDVTRMTKVITENSVTDQKAGNSLNNKDLDTRMTLNNADVLLEDRLVVPKLAALLLGNGTDEQDIPQPSLRANSLPKSESRALNIVATQKPEVTSASIAVRVSGSTGVRYDVTQKIRIVDIQTFQCSACMAEFGTCAAFERHRNETCRNVGPTVKIAQRFICQFCGFACGSMLRCHEHVSHLHMRDRLPAGEPAINNTVGAPVPKSSMKSTAIRPQKVAKMHPKALSKATKLQHGAGVEASPSNGKVCHVLKPAGKKDRAALKGCVQYRSISMFAVKTLACTSCHQMLKGPPSPGQPQQCTECKSSDSLEMAIVYQCMYCEQMFGTKQACRFHEITKCMKCTAQPMLNLAQGMYTCEYCKRLYSRKQDFTKHMRKHHGPNCQIEATNTDSVANATDIASAQQQPLTSEPGRHQCPTCLLTFTAATPLKLHILNEHGYGRVNTHKTQIRKTKRVQNDLQLSIVSKTDVLSGERVVDGTCQAEFADNEWRDGGVSSVHSPQNESVNSSQGANIVSQPSLPVMLTTKNAGVLTNGCDIRGAPATGSLPSSTVWHGSAVSSGVPANSVAVQSNHVLLPSSSHQEEPSRETTTRQVSADDSVQLLLDTLRPIECPSVESNASEDSTEKGLDGLSTCILAQLADMLSEQKGFFATDTVASTQADHQMFVPSVTPAADDNCASRQLIKKSPGWPIYGQATVADSRQTGYSRHECISSNEVVSGEGAPPPNVGKTLADVSLSMNSRSGDTHISGDTTEPNSEQQETCNQVSTSTMTTREPGKKTSQANKSMTLPGVYASWDFGSQGYQDSADPAGVCVRPAESVTVDTAPNSGGAKPTLFGLDFSRTIYVKLVPRKKPEHEVVNELKVPEALDGGGLGDIGHSNVSVVGQAKPGRIPTLSETDNMTIERNTQHDSDMRQTCDRHTYTDVMSPPPQQDKGAAGHRNVMIGEDTSETGSMLSAVKTLTLMTYGESVSAVVGDTSDIPNVQTVSDSPVTCGGDDVSQTLNALNDGTDSMLTEVVGTASDFAVNSQGTETLHTSSCVTDSLPDGGVYSAAPVVPNAETCTAAPVVPDDETCTAAPVMPGDEAYAAASVVPDDETCTAAPVVPNDDTCTAAPVVPDDEAYTAAPVVPDDETCTAAPVVPDDEAYTAAPVVPDDETCTAAPIVPDDEAYTAAPVVPDDETCTAAPVAPDDETCTAAPVVPNDETCTAAHVMPDDKAYTAVPVVPNDETCTAAPVVPDDEAYTAAPVVPDDETCTAAPVMPDDEAYTAAPVVPDDETCTAAPVVPNDETCTAAPVVPDDEACTAAPVMPDDEAYMAAPVVPVDEAYTAAPVVPVDEAYTAALVVPVDEAYTVALVPDDETCTAVPVDEAYTAAPVVPVNEAYTAALVPVDEAYIAAPVVPVDEAYTAALVVPVDEAYTAALVPDDQAYTAKPVGPNDVVYITAPVITDVEAYATLSVVPDDEACTAAPVVSDEGTYIAPVVPNVLIYTTTHIVPNNIVYTTTPVVQDDNVYTAAPVVPDDVVYATTPVPDDGTHTPVVPDDVIYTATSVVSHDDGTYTAPVVPHAAAPVIPDDVIYTATSVVSHVDGTYTAPVVMAYTTAPVLSDDKTYTSPPLSEEQEELPFDLAVQEIPSTLDQTGSNNTETIVEDTPFIVNEEIFHDAINIAINDVIAEEVVINSVHDGGDVLDHLEAESCTDGTDEVGVSVARHDVSDGQATEMYMQITTSDYVKSGSTSGDSTDRETVEEDALDHESCDDDVSATNQCDILDKTITKPDSKTHRDDLVVSKDVRSNNFDREITEAGTENTEELRYKSETETTQDSEFDTDDQMNTDARTDIICCEMTKTGPCDIKVIASVRSEVPDQEENEIREEDTVNKIGVCAPALAEAEQPDETSDAAGNIGELSAEVKDNESVSLVAESTVGVDSHTTDKVFDTEVIVLLDEGGDLCPVDEVREVTSFTDEESRGDYTETESTFVEPGMLVDVETQPVVLEEHKPVVDDEIYEESMLTVGEDKFVGPKESKSAVSEEEYVATEQRKPAVRGEFVSACESKRIGSDGGVLLHLEKTMSSPAQPKTENMTVVSLPKALDREAEESVHDNTGATMAEGGTNRQEDNALVDGSAQLETGDNKRTGVIFADLTNLGTLEVTVASGLTGDAQHDEAETLQGHKPCTVTEEPTSEGVSETVDDKTDFQMADAEPSVGLQYPTEKLTLSSEQPGDISQTGMTSDTKAKYTAAKDETNVDAATLDDDEETPSVNSIKHEENETIKTEAATESSKLAEKTAEREVGSRQCKAVLASQRKYTCEHCTPCLSYSRRYSFQLHQKIVHNIRSDRSEERMPKEGLVCPICHGAPEFNDVLGLQCHMKWLHGVNNFSLASPTPQTPVGNHSEGVSDDNGDVKEGVDEECKIEEGNVEGVDAVVVAADDDTSEIKEILPSVWPSVTDAAEESTAVTDGETAQLHQNVDDNGKTDTVVSKTDDTKADLEATPVDGEGVVNHKDVDGSTAVSSDGIKGVVDDKEVDDSTADTSDCLDSTTDSEVQRIHDSTTRKRRGMRLTRRKGSFQRTTSGKRKKQTATSCSSLKRRAETEASSDDLQKLVSTGGLRTRSGVVLPEMIPPSRMMKLNVEQPMLTDVGRSDSQSPVRSPQRKPTETGRHRSAATEVSHIGGLRTRSGVVLQEIIPPCRPAAASPKSRVKTTASVVGSADGDHVKPSTGKAPANKGIGDTVPAAGSGGGLRTRSGVVLPERIPPSRYVVAKPDVCSPTGNIASSDVALPGDSVVPSDSIEALSELNSFDNGETKHPEAREHVEECEPQQCMPPKETDVVKNVATSDSCDIEQTQSRDIPEDDDMLCNNPTQSDDPISIDADTYPTSEPADEKRDHTTNSNVLRDMSHVEKREEHPATVDAVHVVTSVERPASRVPGLMNATVVGVVPRQMRSDNTGTSVDKPKIRRMKRHKVHSRDHLAVRTSFKRGVPQRKMRSSASENNKYSKPCSIDGEKKQPDTNKTDSPDIEFARPTKDIGEMKSSSSLDDSLTQNGTNDTVTASSVAANDTQQVEARSSLSRKRSSPDRLETSAGALDEPPPKMSHPVTGLLYECQLCGEQYTRRYHLERHMSRFHEKKSTSWHRLDDNTLTILVTNLPWRCVQCDRKFMMARAWHTHMATEHKVSSPIHRSVHAEVGPEKPDLDVASESAKSASPKFKTVGGEMAPVKSDFDVATESIKSASTTFTTVRESDAYAKCSGDDVVRSNTEKCEESPDVGERAPSTTQPEDNLETVTETTQDALVATADIQFALSSPMSGFEISWLKTDTRSPRLTAERRPVPNSSLPWLSERPPAPQHNVYVGKRSKQTPGLAMKPSSDEVSSQDLSDETVTEQPLAPQPLSNGTSRSIEHPTECSSLTGKEKSSGKSLSKERCSDILLSPRNISQSEQIPRIRRSAETQLVSSDTFPAKVGIRRSSSDFTGHEEKTKSPTRRLSESHERKAKSSTRRLCESREKKRKSPTRRLSESQDLSASTDTAKLATPRRPSTGQRLGRTGSPRTWVKCKTSKTRSVSRDVDQVKNHTNKMSSKSKEKSTVQSISPAHSATCDMKPRKRHLWGSHAASLSVGGSKVRGERRPLKHKSVESQGETNIHHRHTTDRSSEAAVKTHGVRSYKTGASVSASRQIGSKDKSVCHRRSLSASCATSRVKGVSFGEALTSVSPHRTRSVHTTIASRHKHKSKTFDPSKAHVPSTSSDEKHSKRRATLQVQSRHSPGARPYKNTAVSRLSPQKRSHNSASRHGSWRFRRSPDNSTKISSKLPGDRRTVTAAPTIKSSESHEKNTTYNKTDDSSHLQTCTETSEFPRSASHDIVRENTYLQSSTTSRPDMILRGESDSHRRNSSKRDGRSSRDSPHTARRNKTKFARLKRSASEDVGSLTRSIERTSAVSQSASVKLAKRDRTTAKVPAPPTDTRARNPETCKTVPRQSSAKQSNADAKEKTASDPSEPSVGGRMSKRRRTFPDLFGVPLNSSYIT